MIVLSGLAMLAALLALALLLLGPARIWDLFGPADLGPVDFARLERRSSPNDALACPEGMCGTARVDIVTPIFAMEARALRAAMTRALAAEPDLTRVAANADGLSERYVQRTRRLGFPDTIDLRYVDLPGGRSTIALYSRSKLGYGDLGANRARIERWLARLAGESSAGAVTDPAAPP
jgi:uncharacterized protein (DUF1499 family)